MFFQLLVELIIKDNCEKNCLENLNFTIKNWKKHITSHVNNVEGPIRHIRLENIKIYPLTLS